MKRIRTQTKGMKPMNLGGIYPSKRDLSTKEEAPNTLAIYTYLTGDPDPVTKEPMVEYQVQAHFEWNEHRPELKNDRVSGKHFEIAKRSLERGGRQDVFLGTRECQGYVEPCVFGAGDGAYDGPGELQYGLMFHSFDYPDETGKDQLVRNLWRPKLVSGILVFPRPDDLTQVLKSDIRSMGIKPFGVDQSVRSVEAAWQEYAATNGGTV
jgi:CRISPR-associated protein Cas5d